MYFVIYKNTIKMTDNFTRLYYLTSVDVLEYLVKRNSENILLNGGSFSNSKNHCFEYISNSRNDVNLNFLKKHLFYDIEYFFNKLRPSNLINNSEDKQSSKNVNSNIKIINEKIYIVINLKKIYEYFQSIFKCKNWISIDYLNFKENYQYLDYPIMNIDIGFKTDFKDIINSALCSSIYEILNINESVDLSHIQSEKQYIFIKYEKLCDFYINSKIFQSNSVNSIGTLLRKNEDIENMKSEFNNEFKNIFLLF